MLLQGTGEGLAGELTTPSANSGQALISVEDFWLSLAQRFLQSLDAEISIQGVGKAPGHHMSTAHA